MCINVGVGSMKLASTAPQKYRIDVSRIKRKKKKIDLNSYQWAHAPIFHYGLNLRSAKRDRRYFNRTLTSRRCCAPLHSVLINSKGVYRFYNVGILIHRRIHTIATRKSVEIHIGRGRDMAGIYNKVIPVMKRLYTYLPKRELHRM